MLFSEQRLSNALILTLSGRMDTSLALILDRKISEHIESGERLINLNLSKLDYMSSSGIRVFVSAARRLEKLGGGLTLSAPAPQIVELLEVTQIDKVIPIHPDNGAAVVALSKFNRAHNKTESPASADPLRQETRRNEKEGYTYTVWVDENGQEISGHDPLRLEQEEREWHREQHRFDERIKHLEEQRAQLEAFANRQRFGGIDSGPALFLMLLLALPALSLAIAGVIQLFIGWPWWVFSMAAYGVLFGAVYAAPWSQQAGAREKAAEILSETQSLQADKRESIRRRGSKLTEA